MEARLSLQDDNEQQIKSLQQQLKSERVAKKQMQQFIDETSRKIYETESQLKTLNKQTLELHKELRLKERHL